MALWSVRTADDVRVLQRMFAASVADRVELRARVCRLEAELARIHTALESSGIGCHTDKCRKALGLDADDA